MAGQGYAVTGYSSLEALYFGTISKISNTMGTSSYTLSELKQAVGEILLARQPAYVRTLDYLSSYDAGDHSDHLTVGKLVKSLVSTYSPSASISGYMGYPVSNMAPTMTQASANFTAKTAAFFTYTPFDIQECTSFLNCYNAGRGESYWLLRQYIVTPALATVSTIGVAEYPAVMPGGSNVAELATVSATSVSSGQPAFAAIDGNLGGYPGNSSAEWVAKSGAFAGVEFLVDWGTVVYNISSIVLYDRPNTNGELRSRLPKALALTRLRRLAHWRHLHIHGRLDRALHTVRLNYFLSFSYYLLTPRCSYRLWNDGSATVFNLNPPVLTSSILLTVESVASSTSQVCFLLFTCRCANA